MRHNLSKNKTRPLFTLTLEMTRLVNETRLLLVPSVNLDIYSTYVVLLHYSETSDKVKDTLKEDKPKFEDSVEPLNKDTFGTRHFVLCREVVLFQRCMIFYRACIHEYCRLVLCWEVCPLLESPLLDCTLVYTLYRKSPLKEDNPSLTKDKNGWSRRCPY